MTHWTYNFVAILILRGFAWELDIYFSLLVRLSLLTRHGFSLRRRLIFRGSPLSRYGATNFPSLLSRHSFGLRRWPIGPLTLSSFYFGGVS
jgi:hypothetical protein